MPRPGFVLRASLVLLAGLFLPLGIWFVFAKAHRYWGNGLALIVVAIVFLRLGLSRAESGWMAAIDDLDGRPGERQ